MKLILFGLFMILALVGMCLVCGCSHKLYRVPEDYNYVRDPLTAQLYIEPFSEDTIKK